MRSLRSIESGFSLAELLVVIVILGILASLGASGFQSLIQSQRVKGASFELFASLSLARSEAIKRNTAVTLTPTDSANWGKGWTITSAAGTIKSQSELKKVSISQGPVSVVYAPNGRAGAATFTLPDPTYPRCIKTELSGMPRSYKPVNGAC